ncbi:MAG: hypothetical protein ACUVUS_10345, partial [Thermoproteota archaeon]
DENTTLTIGLKPEIIEGSFTNHVFDHWVDSGGEEFKDHVLVDRPLSLNTAWREELNTFNISIVVIMLIIAFAIPELKKRVSIEIVWHEEESKNEGDQHQDA